MFWTLWKMTKGKSVIWRIFWKVYSCTSSAEKVLKEVWNDNHKKESKFFIQKLSIMMKIEWFIKLLMHKMFYYYLYYSRLLSLNSCH